MTEPPRMSLALSDDLDAKANRFPESSYGATTVTLILRDGRCIRDVILGGASHIVKVQGRQIADAGELGFSVGEVTDVARNDRPSLAILTAAVRRLVHLLARPH